MLSLYSADTSVIITGAVFVPTIHSFNAEHKTSFNEGLRAVNYLQFTVCLANGAVNCAYCHYNYLVIHKYYLILFISTTS